MTNSEHSEGTIDADAMYRVPTNFSGLREGDAWRATHISRRLILPERQNHGEPEGLAVVTAFSLKLAATLGAADDGLRALGGLGELGVLRDLSEEWWG